MENGPKMEGELSKEALLHEELDTLQIKELDATSDEERDVIVGRINAILKELGQEESITPAA